eukprot:254489-Rhodomonas_salina.1
MAQGAMQMQSGVVLVYAVYSDGNTAQVDWVAPSFLQRDPRSLIRFPRFPRSPRFRRRCRHAVWRAARVRLGLNALRVQLK